MGDLNIPPLPAEVVFHIGSIPVTNTIVNTWLAIVVFLVFGIILRKKIALRPGRLQNTAEYFLETVVGYFDNVTGDRTKTVRFLPIAGSVFFFILLSNWLGVIPGAGSITLHHEALLRSANTDLNLTVAMALVSVIVSHLFGFATIGFFSYVNKFIKIGSFIKSIPKGPMAVFTAFIELGVGLIEIISECAKVISLSLRLFGNIFAGEVLMTVISSLVGLLVPAPFMLLELLVGLIQAGVFAILTLVYLTTATAEIHAGDH